MKTGSSEWGRSQAENAELGPPVGVDEGVFVFPASFGQERLWFLDQLEPGTTVYNEATGYRLRGALDLSVLQRSIDEIVRRHEALRTTFSVEDGRPLQVVEPARPLNVSVIQVPPERYSESDLLELVAAAAERPFDLAKGPLFRVDLFRVGQDDQILLLTLHHIVIDGVSTEHLLHELSTLYSALGAGSPSPLPELEIQYADFAAWQRELLAGDELVRQRTYWTERLAGLSPLELPFDRPRSPVQTHRGALHRFSVPGPVASALKAIGLQERATVFMATVASFLTLLHRVTGVDDLGVGTPVAGRSRPEFDGLIGFLSNALVLRVDLEGAPTFREVLARTRDAAIGLYAHQDIPFQELGGSAGAEGRASLLQVSFVMLPPRAAFTLGDTSATPIDIHRSSAKFDLTLFLADTGGGFRAVFEYNAELFDASTIESLARQYQTLLVGVTADPDISLQEIPLLTLEERRLVVDEWNRTAVPFAEHDTIASCFSRQAAATPGEPAVTCQDETWTYRQLELRADAIADRLRRAGAGPEVVVGVCLERSVDLVAALLGVMKSGAAYLPLDPTYPPERLAAMIDDAMPLVVVASDRTAARLMGVEAAVLQLSEVTATAVGARSVEASFADSRALAYVIYTSGSTGRPKGVMVEHRSVMNFFAGMDPLLGREAGVWLAVASVSFDISVLELWWPLARGFHVVLWPGLDDEDASIPALIRRHGVTHMQSVPSFLRMVMRQPGAIAALASVRVQVVGGEAVPPSLIRDLGPSTGRRIIDCYGPTETTVISTAGDIPMGAEAVSIGRPIANTKVFVLDAKRQPVPPGTPGELYIGGAGVARGYMNQPDLTAERFVADPFDATGSGRLYRTGDVVRFRKNGELEYVGRTDEQVKIRGHRVELGEIDRALNLHPSVQTAVVHVLPGPGDESRLVGYFVSREGKLPGAAELRDWLGQRLPTYMIPSAFVALADLPRSANGKLDRQRLPAPVIEAAASDALVAPRTPLETQVAAIFCDVLELPTVSVDDNFFDLGGQSLLAIQLMSRLGAAFGVELPLQLLFEAPTAAGVASRLNTMVVPAAGADPRKIGRQVRVAVQRSAQSSETGRDWGEEIPGSADAHPAHVDSSSDEVFLFPASFGQQRLWFLEQLEPDTAVYNMPIAYRLAGRLDVAVLGRAVDELVARHEALRTTFVVEDGALKQVIAPTRTVLASLVEVPTDCHSEAPLIALVAEAAARPFDLAVGPLFRVEIFRLNAEDHVLLLTLHHIVGDGVSIRNLLRELTQLCADHHAGRRPSLPELPLQYADFAVWQGQNLGDEALAGQLAYWRTQLANAAPLDLPIDRSRPKTQTFRGATVPIRLPRPLVDAVSRIAREHRATTFIVLAAALQLLLHRYTRQTDVTLGVPVAGRTLPETDALIGFFVNTVVLRADISADPTGRDFLDQVRETTQAALANQDVPFERVVEGAGVPRQMNVTPLFQVFLAMQGLPETTLQWPGVTGTVMPVDLGIAKFDLTLYLNESVAGVAGVVEYNTDLFDASTVVRFTRNFETLLAALTSTPDSRVSTLPVLDVDERVQVLETWNVSRRAYPREQTVVDLFEAQAARTPDASAVRFEGTGLPYAALGSRAEVVARALRACGVGPGVLVGICLERSLDLLVGILGILKAGGAYVPLDPAFPVERLTFMLDDSGAPVLLTETKSLGIVGSEGRQVVCLDTLAFDELVAPVEEEAKPRATPQDLAYVLYTSGSTGKPKGVEISHRALTNFLWAMRDEPGCTASDVVLAVTTLSFDIAGLELWLPLICGGQVEMVSRSVAADGRLLRARLDAGGVTILQATPVTWRMLIEAGWTGTPGLKALIGGESLPADLVQPLLDRTASLWNMYGPTETTIWSSVQQVTSAAAEITVGRPIANTTFYILDAQQQPVPVGVAGELYIGGDGLARGYHGRPELTAEKFVPHPFVSEPGARLYRTGDLAKYRADGQVVHLGRLDHQVKIRGFRIELGEIEAALGLHPGVRQAAVVARDERPGQAMLVAYWVADVEPAPMVTNLRTHLKQTLPDYMVPQHFVALAALPLTPNGKIDRKQLPAPVLEAVAPTAMIAPRTPVETQVAALFCEVLRLPTVSVDDSFFDLGGQSLLAIRLMSRLEAVFTIALPLQVLFDAPTVAGVAGRLDTMAMPAAGAGPRKIGRQVRVAVQRSAQSPETGRD